MRGLRVTGYESEAGKEGDSMGARSTWLRVLILGGGVASLPVTIDAASGSIKVNEACAQNGGGSGMCCPQIILICFPPSCGPQPCGPPHHLWYRRGGPLGPRSSLEWCGGSGGG